MTTREEGNDVTLPFGQYPKPSIFSSEEMRTNPFSWYKEMREKGSGIHYNDEDDYWYFFRFSDVEQIWNMADGERVTARADGPPSDHPLSPMDHILDFQDSEEHDRLKGFVQPYFTKGYVENHYRPITDDVISDILDESSTPGERLDFVSEVANIVPARVISRIVGASYEKWEPIQMSLLENEDESIEDSQDRISMYIDFFEHMNLLYEERKTNPQDDLISNLIHKGPETEGPTKKEIIATCFIALVGGSITTVGLLTHAMQLIDEKNLFQPLQREDMNLKLMMEEVLRYRSPLQQVGFKAASNFSIRGTEISKGDKLGLWIGSANRDPRKFDQAGSFVPDRSPNPHLAFARGSHYCLGAHLGRQEGVVCASEILNRYTDLEVHMDETKPTPGSHDLAFSEMPITFYK